MVSHPEVRKRLAEFVCVRLDWEQMMKAKQKYGLKVPTQGNQILLDPKGHYIPGIEPTGKRYEIGAFKGLLDSVLKDFPPKGNTRNDLKLAWFLVDPKDQRPGGDCASISKLERKPVVTIHGEPPAWLKDDPEFLRKHIREFIWRQVPASESRMTVEQFEPERKELASLSLGQLTAAQVSERLDTAWLEYMKVRPMYARGYIDNPHGNWLKNVMENVATEEIQIREQAVKGTLLPPGRKK